MKPTTRASAERSASDIRRTCRQWLAKVPKVETWPCVDRQPGASGAPLSVSPRATVIPPVARGRDGAKKEWRSIQCVR